MAADSNIGYRVKSVKVNDVEKLPLINNKLTLINVVTDATIVVEVEKIEYVVTNGSSQQHIIGKEEDADKSLFLKVYLNNEK